MQPLREHEEVAFRVVSDLSEEMIYHWGNVDDEKLIYISFS